MKAESIVFALAGSLFGLLAGWILGSQQTLATRATLTQMAPPQAAAPAAAGGSSGPVAPPQATPLDEGRAQALRTVAEQNASDPTPRIGLGNMYFDAERYSDAITWYEEALKIAPANADVSTDLGVAYYYVNQPDRALARFEHSLSVNPRHTKTLLNLGIVKAFGKQDLTGAASAWRQVIALAPDSPEGQAARKALEGLTSAHPATPGGE